ncbi:unnamed protein product [Candidula unifasciata]|uniref:Uncharacterized protein n=1 Tax=Candidula unifasciata TaxID=100452 RepID=A0A8S3Z2P5_9EUPU|nr:unnamed protein product [Candidula unifasciata]
MTLVIRNMQRTVKLNIRQLRVDVGLLLKLCDLQSHDLGLLLVSDYKIRRLNSEYRQVNEVTDVLAFPCHEISPENAGHLPDVEDEDKMLGDIVLGISYIHQQSKKHSEHFESVLLTMVTHGICHLVGYDHDTRQQWEQMYKRELDILEKFNKQTGYKCSPLLGVGHYTET